MGDLDILEYHLRESLGDDLHGILGEKGLSVEGIHIILILDSLN